MTCKVFIYNQNYFSPIFSHPLIFISSLISACALKIINWFWSLLLNFKVSAFIIIFSLKPPKIDDSVLEWVSGIFGLLQFNTEIIIFFSTSSIINLSLIVPILVYAQKIKTGFDP